MTKRFDPRPADVGWAAAAGGRQGCSRGSMGLGRPTCSALARIDFRQQPPRFRNPVRHAQHDKRGRPLPVGWGPRGRQEPAVTFRAGVHAWRGRSTQHGPICPSTLRLRSADADLPPEAPRESLRSFSTFDQRLPSGCTAAVYSEAESLLWRLHVVGFAQAAEPGVRAPQGSSPARPHQSTLPYSAPGHRLPRSAVPPFRRSANQCFT